MKQQDYDFLTKWFTDFVRGFYSDDPDVQHHVKIKEGHTARVCDNMRAIGCFLQLGPEERQLAETVALLHDVGRFPQYARYHTFNDFLSENHAKLGVRVLSETKILSRLPQAEQARIEKAVLYHNYRELPPEEDLLFAKMIRDADKLDIFEMIVSEDEKLKMPKSPELGDGEGVTPCIMEDLLANRLAKYEDIHTAADQILFRVSWLYNIYFTYSFQVMQQQQYLTRMLSELPQTGDIIKVRRHVESYLAEKCKAR